MSGLYIHIPFCRTKCIYCDFYSMPPRMDMGQYVDALLAEFSARREEVPAPFSTVYVGGGTPSVLPVDELLRLIRGVVPDPASIEEFTVEANPDDITPDWCGAVKAAGVSRVSLGVQSFVDAELEAVGRRHSAADALRAIDTIRQAGVEEISIDLIYGLPGQTMDSWSHSLDVAMSAGVPHLSAYTLTYEPGTRLYARRQAGKIIEATDDTIEAMYVMLVERTRRNGYCHYEISNFALPGHHARHNSSYWAGIPYLGIGAAAHSFDGRCRRWNPRSLKEYMAAPVAAFEVEEPDGNTLYNDAVMTALRTSHGIQTDIFNGAELRLIERYVSRGMMEYTSDGRCRIAEKHWLVSDSIISDLFRVD